MGISRWQILSFIGLFLAAGARDSPPTQDWGVLCDQKDLAEDYSKLLQQAVSCELSGRLDEAHRHYAGALRAAVEQFGEADTRTKNARQHFRLFQSSNQGAGRGLRGRGGLQAPPPTGAQSP